VAPASVPVLIQGASGTGKELVARAIHKNSQRRDKEYVTENCAAIPETLLESELFGYTKGAFTGAEKNKRGLFVAADGGTLFLDEIGDMSLNMQKKLLRVLQDGEIRPVGSNAVLHVNVRVLSASNKNLRDMVDRKQFREDLFFRLNTITVELPPLRDRASDIPALAAHFIDKVSGEMGVDPAPISEEALEALKRYRWPGNIRELENEMRRCLALKGDAAEIGLNVLSDEVKNG
jgi:transcriptional regulator with PAS, ATPase and Fis domain